MKKRVAVPRSVGHSRAPRTIRRRSAGLSRARAGAALIMMVVGMAIYGLTASPVFAYRHLVVENATFTDGADLASRIGVGEGVNLFQLATGPIGQRLGQLPSVAGVDVSVRLPDTLEVRLHERVPILIWAVGTSRYLVDREGMLFAEATDPPATDPPAEVGTGLPVVDDKRAQSVDLGIGQHLATIDLDAATRLGGLQPARDLGSRASGLGFTVDDTNGYVVSGKPIGWQAIFGFYTPTLRRTDLIAGQVRLLASLLAKAGETTVSSVVLATDLDGTYVPRASARATSRGSPSPGP
jgi:hypothetical protein